MTSTKSYIVDTPLKGTNNLTNNLVHKCHKFLRESSDHSQQTLAFQKMKKEDSKWSKSILTNIHFDVNAGR